MGAVVTRIGGRVSGWIESLGRAAVFGGLVLRAIARPPLRLRAVADGVFDSGVLSLALVCGSGLTVGLVLGLQLYNTLVQFGAEESLGTAVGLSLIRELGPVLTALLVTGRAGSAVTAEIGAMKATEQLDGLRMMAIDPIHFVAMPRALALALSMPLLSALFIVFGIGGAYLVGVELLGLDGGSYLSSIERSVDFHDTVAQSLVKSAVFGVLVGWLATWRGVSCEPNAAGVSRATTSTVVTASVWILLSDYAITAIWEI